MNKKLLQLQKIAEIEFRDIVKISFMKDYKLRVILIDGSFIDVNVSQKLKDKFSFHWECKNEKMYRYDNFPDKKARKLKTFPFHFHNGSQENIVESEFSTNLEEGFRNFLNFIRKELKEYKLEEEENQS